MAHPAFQGLHEEAANSGFKSIALVAVGGASLGVSAEYMKGVL
jgi:hypothetical protein